jgi:hypothetical protein
MTTRLLLATTLILFPSTVWAQRAQIVKECTAQLPKNCGSCVGEMPNIVICEIEKTYPQAQDTTVRACVSQLFARAQHYNITDAQYEWAIRCSLH